MSTPVRALVAETPREKNCSIASRAARARLTARGVNKKRTGPHETTSVATIKMAICAAKISRGESSVKSSMGQGDASAINAPQSGGTKA